MQTIKNPIEWSGAQIVHTAHAIGSAYSSLQHIQDTIHSPAPAVRKIGTAEVWTALAKGFDDFEAYRSDVIFLCITYAVVGLVLSRLAFGMDMLPLLFPLASGFALIGPVAAVGLYELSRRREQGVAVSWANVFDILQAPAVGAIAVLGMALVAVFLLWLTAAWEIYRHTLGPPLPTSVGAFLNDVFLTDRGHLLIIIGVGVGFVFALFVMAISIVSFPLLVDRDVGLDTAIRTSIRAVAANPVPMALWGLIVAGALVIGSLPVFVGLAVVLPVLGHATWHLYRSLVPR